MKRITTLLLGLLIISLTPIMITDIVVYNEEIEVYDNEPTLIEIELPQGKDTKNIWIINLLQINHHLNINLFKKIVKYQIMDF